MSKTMQYTIGFVGQGWVGKNYADHFEERGFSTIRYSLEKPHVDNKDKIMHCDIVFIAVPTPTTPEGFDDQHVLSALTLVGKGKIAVIKSTIPLGTTLRLAELHADKYILHIPEFLREAHARYDVDSPERVFIGIPKDTHDYRKHAETLRDIHPKANYTKIISAHEAEFVKYTHNTLGYTTVVFVNLLHDLAVAQGIEWSVVKEAIINNPWYPSKYLDPIHQGGRGAGGDCFIKDFAALREMYNHEFPEDQKGIAFLDAMVAKNNQLLRDSGKSVDLLNGVYGEPS